jgi:DNA repair protein RadC
VGDEMKISDYMHTEKPRERLKEVGAQKISNYELLAIVIGSGAKDNNVINLSKEILNSLETVNDMSTISIEYLKQFKGIGENKAITILAAIELGKRVFNINHKETKMKIHNAASVFEQVRSYYFNKKQEVLMAIYLDNQKRIIKEVELFKGTINQSIVHPREVFKYALELNASFIILIHNHPSGDLTPSKDDLSFTKRMIELSELMQIKVIDHLIVSSSDFLSLRDNKYIRYW